jgi:hypothetical protein
MGDMSGKSMIFYWPKEGTTGFWGLIGLAVGPTPDDFPDSEIGKAGYKVSLGHYESYLESCKEKKLEIVNPEECFTYGPYARNGSNEVIKFKEGEIFDLPIGYEFKPDKKCQHNGIHNSTCIYHEVLRLVKVESEESQEEMINELVQDMFELGNEGVLNKWTIQRKKP